MNKFLILATLAITFVLAANAKPANPPAWNQYKQKYQKKYSKDEDTMRKTVYQANVKKIEQHNQKHKAGKATFTMGVNQFTDLTYEEVVEQFTGAKIPDKKMLHMEMASPSVGSKLLGSAPDSIDWVTQGAVMPVKNQGNCGCCWAFSACGALESAWYIKYGKDVELSEQQLVDCSDVSPYENEGCNGGWYTEAFQYVKDNGGIDSLTGYPYTDTNASTCAYNSNYNVATCTGYVEVQSQSEAALTEAVGLNGPVSVAILATQNLFNYQSGVLDDSDCAGITVYDINHAVLVVGYGTDNGVPYYLLQNSWGTGWGDNGYFKYVRNGSNMCNVATYAAYPTV